MSGNNMFKNLPNRNNTSFGKKLYETLKSLSTSRDSPIRYHQQLVIDYVLEYNVRGILAYHKMGSGKTILGVAICEALLEKSDWKVLFISPKSLHGNFKAAIKQYYELTSKPTGDGVLDSHISSRYSFIASNASNMLDQVNKAVDLDVIYLAEDNKPPLSSLENTIIIQDEWHDFLNAVANGSKNAIGLYDMVMNTKNIKIIGLTGTPIVNDPYEIALGFNMLQGPLEGGETLFGEDYFDFVRRFIAEPKGLDVDVATDIRPKIKNADKFQDRIMGLVSYYGADTPEMLEAYPTEYELIIKRVPMAKEQFVAYTAARDRELEESKRGFFGEKRQRLKKPSSSVSSSYRVRSRQISNFHYPEYASSTYRDDKGFVHYEKYIDKLLPESLKISKSFLKSEKSKNDSGIGLENLSSKMVELLHTLAIHMPAGILDELKPTKVKLNKLIKKRTKINEAHLARVGISEWQPGIGPGVIYSQFLDSGILLVAKILSAYGFVEIRGPDDFKKHSSGSYAIISGEILPELRDNLKDEFNNPNNKDGSRISLLLITSTGAQGLDLKCGRHVHILEPYWHWSRIRQVITRINRMFSHKSLEPSERTVQPYIYLSDYPKTKGDELKLIEPATDIVLFSKALQNQMLINDFLKAMTGASIDCMIHYEKSDDVKCRICSPTGKVLWHSDIDKDIDNESPCKPITHDVISVKKIIVSLPTGDISYAYMIDGKIIRIFEFADDLGGYTEIFANHPNFDSIEQAIIKKERIK